MSHRVLVTLLVNNQVGSFFHYPVSSGNVWFHKKHSSFLVAEHGLAMLVEVIDHEEGMPVARAPRVFSLLWDVGSVNETILHNMARFNPTWEGIDAIVLSHGHYDHMGALEPVLDQLPAPVDLYYHPIAPSRRYFRRSASLRMADFVGEAPRVLAPHLETEAVVTFPSLVPERLESKGATLHVTGQPTPIYEDAERGLTIQTTGEIPRVHEEEVVRGFIRVNAEDPEQEVIELDAIPDDQALVITRAGHPNVLLLGCCHSGLMNTLDLVRNQHPGPFKYLIGGMHLASASTRRLDATIAYLRALPGDRVLFPIHCSGPKFPARVENLHEPSLRAFDASVGTQWMF